jgi:CheY-like chemotaxis protein
VRARRPIVTDSPIAKAATLGRVAKILLIDDEDAVRSHLRQALAGAGHTVIEARDGREGLELFEHVGADLVITDIVMPEKEGIEVLLTLRKVLPPVKIIAMAGGRRESAAAYLHMATLLGAAKVLEKPFAAGVLIAAIAELMAGGDATAPSPGPA